jgi:hypothetical protein
MPLPTGTELINRLNLDDPSGKLKAFCDPLAAAALETIRTMTDLALPVEVITGEAPFVSTYNQTVITDRWPVISVQGVQWLTTSLRVGTLSNLYTGKADVAIAARAEGLELSATVGGTDRRGLITVDYTAGFDTLPPDLYEAWAQIAMQYYHETKRSGLDETVTDSNTTKYTRVLPPLVRMTIGKYQRFQMP